MSRLHMPEELTIYHAAALRVQLAAELAAALADAGAGPLELDLGAVAEIDASGVQLLIAARKSAHAKGIALRLASPSPAVQEVMALLRLADH